jgi:hypothetical protein
VSASSLLLALKVLWLGIALLVCGYPLLTGRMRMGKTGSSPLLRQSNPRGFWTAYAISTGLFLLASGGAAWFLTRLIPR